MKKLNIALLLISLALISFSCKTKNPKDPQTLYSEIDKTAAPNTLTDDEANNGWKLLFDGITNNGWHGYNLGHFPASWAIEDGTLTMNTEGGAESQDIVTDKKYGSFAIYLEYKLTPAANSGLIYQVAEDTIYHYSYETGPEVQIIDHEGWPEKIEDWQINGANYAMYPPKAHPYKAVGEWNQLFLEVDGNNVTQILNGVEIVSFVKNTEEWTKLRNSGKWSNFPDWGKFDEGFIALQNHGTKVWFRSIKLKEL